MHANVSMLQIIHRILSSQNAIFQPKWKILAFSHDMNGQISWRQIKSESGHLGVLGLNFPSARSVISPVLGHSTHWSRGRGCQPLVRQKGSSAGTNTGIIGQHQPGSQKTSMQSLIFFSSEKLHTSWHWNAEGPNWKWVFSWRFPVSCLQKPLGGKGGVIWWHGLGNVIQSTLKHNKHPSCANEERIQDRFKTYIIYRTMGHLFYIQFWKYFGRYSN